MKFKEGDKVIINYVNYGQSQGRSLRCELKNGDRATIIDIDSTRAFMETEIMIEAINPETNERDFWWVYEKDLILDLIEQRDKKLNKILGIN